MKLNRANLFIMLSIFFMCPASAVQPKINWYTEDYPPFNYMHEGQIEGISIKVLRAMYKQLDWTFDEEDILLMPWARVYKTLEDSPNACVFSITYTEERARQFNFIGPMIHNTVSLIGHKESDYSDVDLKNIPGLKVGVVKNDIGHQLLVKEGFHEYQFVYLKTGYELVRMLKLKRVDLIAYGDVIARFQFSRAHIDPNNYKIIAPLYQSFLGMACNKAVDDEVIKTLNQTLVEVLKEYPSLATWHEEGVQ
ncbi:substrate-binding periplasmic protein [Pseudoalteromonas xiamenensis]|uniref:Transporter substrate-binding domain-containing protein n=1 Tax=Pseudoalteromonas xiamenensis TaxID=882626 RepID=A0A975DGY5_9GAMM|nr:transporter substrate-binding domain-containing protein [Pseudoalteromonas xiamenensis]QTH71399.1 transporter substrate-binding domain-containing protein [Pseudoalteromonas xiamenensis]